MSSVLPQHVSTATYFARVKVNGKIFRESLETTVFTAAKLRLTDFLKEKISNKPKEVDEQYFNSTLGTLRSIFKRGNLTGDRDPSRNVSRLGVKPKQLTLPEHAQFEQILAEIETSGAGQAHHCADLVRFLAFSGCRLSEARRVTWADVDLDHGHIVARSAKVRKTSNPSESRFVPIIPPMLGHSDGGALAMRTYGRLRQQHSQAMAQRVTFSLSAKSTAPADIYTEAGGIPPQSW